MEEKNLSESQRKWLEASRKIGPGAMTKSERQLLERLYAEMLPKEQQELQQYLQEEFQKKVAEQQGGEDPTEKMLGKTWATPSKKLISAISKAQPPKPSGTNKDPQ
ncbi:MAG: hypothetical protein HY912_11405 [Desulfomonile tiedjei]|uniref:Uncharacterized protein n=1 Tax=Desulfomonile tiedjei TaxID=2358 RepID=A0A9D6V3F7_9BACT|nr:hypothetical protein [Desulfomonile tiedjei]